MGDEQKNQTTKAFEKALGKSKRKKYVLRLYITGMTPRSRIAVENIQKICREYLYGNYELEVIDIYQQPELIKGDQIVAVPTLIKKLPAPLCRLVGDLSKKERVLLGLDLKLK